MLKNFLLVFSVVASCQLAAQQVLEENLHGPVMEHWDKEKTKVASVGFYYKSGKQKTKEKHGKWEYYSAIGKLEEVRNFYRDYLYGAALLYFPNGQLKQEGYFKYGIQDSVYREWNEEGLLMVEGYYRNDRQTDTWRNFYPNGKEKSVEDFVKNRVYLLDFWIDDSLHTQTVTKGTGQMFVFHPTGGIKTYYEYKDGIRHGLFYELTLSGRPLESGKYSNGKKDSTWTSVYYSGTPQKKCTYVEGVLNGEYTTYYENGQINSHGFYTNGLKSGEWEWFKPDGKPEMKGGFLADKQHGKWTYWYESGELSHTAVFDNGNKSGEWSYYYKNGKLLKTGKYESDLKTGVWKTFYESGKLLMSGQFILGKEEGEWLNFWDNGKLKNKSTFRKGELHGDWYSYFKNGKLTLMGQYKNGLKSGPWISNFENGKTKDVITYKVIKVKTGSRRSSMTRRVDLQSQEHGYCVSFSSKDYAKTEEGKYKNGKKHGTWTAYHPGGRIPAVVTQYKNGTLHGIMRQFSKRGKVLQEMAFKEGMKHGLFVVYDNNGKPIIKKEFINGAEKKDNKLPF